MSGRDRRHFRRYAVDEVRGSLRHAPDLVVLNMSLTGLAVETSAPMRIGKSYLLKIGGGDDTVEVPAEVVWCNLVGGRDDAGTRVNVYQAGLDFTSALDDKAPEIFDFMKAHILIDVERELCGRFRLPEPPIGSQGRYDFLVKSIGFPGMFVETDVSCLPPQGSVVDVELRDDRLLLDCMARVAYLERHEPPHGGTQCQVGLEFQDLTLDNCLALDGFIRDLVE